MGWYGLNIRHSLEISRWWGQGSWDGAYPYEMAMPFCESDNLLTTMIYRLGWLPFLLLILILRDWWDACWFAVCARGASWGSF